MQTLLVVADIEPLHLWSAVVAVITSLAAASVFVGTKLVTLTSLFTRFHMTQDDHGKRLEKIESRVDKHHEALIRSGDLDMTGPHAAIPAAVLPGNPHR